MPPPPASPTHRHHPLVSSSPRTDLVEEIDGDLGVHLEEGDAAGLGQHRHRELRTWGHMPGVLDAGMLCLR